MPCAPCTSRYDKNTCGDSFRGQGATIYLPLRLYTDPAHPLQRSFTMLGTYSTLLSSSSVCRLTPSTRLSACMVLLPIRKACIKPPFSSLACAAGRRSTQSIEQLDQQVVVVGGGAAGLTAAFFAAQEGAKVRKGGGGLCRPTT